MEVLVEATDYERVRGYQPLCLLCKPSKNDRRVGCLVSASLPISNRKQSMNVEAEMCGSGDETCDLWSTTPSTGSIPSPW
jgi:hypothetical protein